MNRFIVTVLTVVWFLLIIGSRFTVADEEMDSEEDRLQVDRIPHQIGFTENAEKEHYILSCTSGTLEYVHSTGNTGIVCCGCDE